MDSYIEVGKIINTFGIKGEVKINSDFEYKERVFKENIELYIGIDKNKEIINTHRIHKNYDLVTFNGYDNINQILKYKGKYVYVLRSSLNLLEDEYLLSDLIGFQVYDKDLFLGVVIDYTNNQHNLLLKVKNDKQEFYLPKVDFYIQKIDLKNKKILTNKGSDLII